MFRVGFEVQEGCPYASIEDWTEAPTSTFCFVPFIYVCVVNLSDNPAFHKILLHFLSKDFKN